MPNNKNINYATLYIVRHGQSEHNVQHIVQGHLDSPLTEEGINQARDLANKLKDIKFSAVYSSDLLRAKRTAEIIGKEQQLAVKTNQLLRERNYGQWQGQESKIYNERIKQALADLKYLEPENRWQFKISEDVESDEEIVARFLTILREIALTHLGQQVLIATHGGLMRTLLMHLGWASHDELPGGSAKNTSYLKLESDGVDFFIKEIVGIEKQIQESGSE